MNKVKKFVCDVARIAASTYALAALALLPATAALAALPSGYGQSEFIQGDGLSAQIVIGDYTPQPNTDKIEAVVSFPSLDKDMAIWCARGANLQVKTWTLFVLKDSSDNKYKWRFDYGTDDAGNNLTPALDTHLSAFYASPIAMSLLWTPDTRFPRRTAPVPVPAAYPALSGLQPTQGMTP